MQGGVVLHLCEVHVDDLANAIGRKLGSSLLGGGELLCREGQRREGALEALGVATRWLVHARPACIAAYTVHDLLAGVALAHGAAVGEDRLDEALLAYAVVDRGG